MGKKIFRVITTIIIILMTAFLANFFQTNGFDVEIKDIRIDVGEGNKQSALLYIPKGASSSNKAPGIVASHGYLNSREMQASFAVELSRRGYVVLAMDMARHGLSDNYNSDSLGAMDAINYLRELDYVDTSRIGFEGHSMGGLAGMLATLQAPDKVNSLLLVGSGTNFIGEAQGNFTSDFPVNMGVIFGRYDEFSELMWQVDSGLRVEESLALKTLFGSQKINSATWYGDIESQTGRVLYTPAETHPWNHFSKISTAYAIDYFDKTLNHHSDFDANRQIWQYKELFNALGMLFLFSFILYLGSFLINIPWLKSVLETKSIKLKNSYPNKFGLGIIVFLLLPGILYIPAFLLNDQLTKVGLLSLEVFPLTWVNGVAIWAVLNAVIGLWSFLSWKRKGKWAIKVEDYGITLNPFKILITFIVASTVVASAYGLLIICDMLFKSDFRLWTVAFKVLSKEKFISGLIYIIPFAIFFTVNSICLNTTIRLKGGWLGQYLLNIAFNTFGIFTLLALEYGHLFMRGSLLFKDTSLIIIIAIPFLLLMPLISIISTYFNRRINNVYLGAFINTLLIVWASVGNTAF